MMFGELKKMPCLPDGRHGIFFNYGFYGQTLLDYKYENVYDLGKSRNSLRTIMQ